MQVEARLSGAEAPRAIPDADTRESATCAAERVENMATVADDSTAINRDLY